MEYKNSLFVHPWNFQVYNQAICLVMYSSAEYITLALKCSKVNLSKRMKKITSGIIVFEKNLESLEFRNSLKQQHYGAEVKVKKKMSANLAAELCTWMNYTMKATNCMLHISNLSLSRHETKMFIGIVYGTYTKNYYFFNYSHGVGGGKGCL